MADGSWGLSRKGATIRYPSGATVVVPEEGPIVKTPPPRPRAEWETRPTAPMPRVTPDGWSSTLVVGSGGRVTQVVSSAPAGDPVAGVGPRGAPGLNARSPKQIADEQIAGFTGGASPANIRATLTSAYWGSRKDTAQYRRLQRAAQAALEEMQREDAARAEAARRAQQRREPMSEVDKFLAQRDPKHAGALTQTPPTGNRAPTNDADRTEALNRLNGPRWGVPMEARGSFDQALTDWQRYGQNAGMPPPEPSDYPDYRNPKRPR